MREPQCRGAGKSGNVALSQSAPRCGREPPRGCGHELCSCLHFKKTDFPKREQVSPSRGGRSCRVAFHALNLEGRGDVGGAIRSCDESSGSFHSDPLCIFGSWACLIAPTRGEYWVAVRALLLTFLVQVFLDEVLLCFAFFSLYHYQKY